MIQIEAFDIGRWFANAAKFAVSGAGMIVRSKKLVAKIRTPSEYGGTKLGVERAIMDLLIGVTLAVIFIFYVQSVMDSVGVLESGALC